MNPLLYLVLMITVSNELTSKTTGIERRSWNASWTTGLIIFLISPFHSVSFVERTLSSFSLKYLNGSCWSLLFLTFMFLFFSNWRKKINLNFISDKKVLALSCLPSTPRRNQVNWILIGKSAVGLKEIRD